MGAKRGIKQITAGWARLNVQYGLEMCGSSRIGQISINHKSGKLRCIGGTEDGWVGLGGGGGGAALERALYILWINC
jgi:hypothetical protein